MAKLNILMFGWEFPPFNSGGLGVACEGLVKALAKKGAKVVFVLPKRVDCQSPFCKIVFADVEVKALPSLLTPYITSQEYSFLAEGLKGFYSSNLFDEVQRYALQSRKIALSKNYHLIHAHDWLSFPAGMMAKRVSGKPLIVHTHATEFDRTGGQGVNSQVYAIEREGFLEADRIIAVSNFTKEKIVQHYGVPEGKIKVVYNAVGHEEENGSAVIPLTFKDKAKIVLFLGRLTLQKGPDYFLAAAQKVLEKKPNVFFIIAGSGDMERQLINQAIDLGIADRVIFTGFLRDQKLASIYKAADLYVLSSVSEPFGITTLEAMDRGTPVLISRQSGVSEILKNCLKVDFWDIHQMASKILAVLNYQELRDELSEHGRREVEKITWEGAAEKCLQVYQEVLTNS